MASQVVKMRFISNPSKGQVPGGSKLPLQDRAPCIDAIYCFWKSSATLSSIENLLPILNKIIGNLLWVNFTPINQIWQRHVCMDLSASCQIAPAAPLFGSSRGPWGHKLRELWWAGPRHKCHQGRPTKVHRVEAAAGWLGGPPAGLKKTTPASITWEIDCFPRCQNASDVPGFILYMIDMSQLGFKLQMHETATNCTNGNVQGSNWELCKHASVWQVIWNGLVQGKFRSEIDNGFAQCPL